ncbi:MAG: hypothetical protein D6805_06045 [Planctomycetota bacterium]|nr:MAG: hypothetical protein D6805_06045 [Planctomycetota bacterium]
MFEQSLKELLEKQKQQGLQQGLEQGLQQGTLKKAQEAVLEARFGELPQELAERVQLVEEVERLDELIVAAACCRSIREFA